MPKDQYLRGIECVKCLINYSLFYSKITNIGIKDVKVVLKYIVDSLADKTFSEIFFGVNKLLSIITKKDQLNDLRNKVFRKSMILYEKAYATLDLVKKFGVENIISRILLLSIVADDVELMLSTSYWDPYKQAKLLINPPIPSFEQTKILDHLPYGLKVGLIVGNISSLLIDRLLVEELVKRGIKVNVYAREEKLLLQASKDDVLSVFGHLPDLVKIDSVSGKPLFEADNKSELIKITNENDIIIVKNFIDVESIISNIVYLDPSIASRYLFVLKNKCDYLSGGIFGDQRYIALFGDQFIQTISGSISKH
ncbi:MAG: hypothetical protein DRO40_01570 [Thermoprotei archaeon]|nr:MAG: hypothetical protein DRO40_01570 [Thermoprotei archaeon]